MKDLAYYNGKISSIAEMMVPFNDRTHFFGDGVYDALIARNGVMFKLADHLDRFFDSMQLININPNFSKETLAQLLSELISRLDTGDLFVYFQVSRGTADRAHNYDPSLIPNLSILLQPRQMVTGDAQRLRVMTLADQRFEFCHIKTLNLLPNVLASQEAALKGLDEVIFHRNQRVTECAHSNISLLIDGVFQTAPLDNWILPGIARKYLLLASEQLGFDISETPFTISQMLAADEVIISSSGGLCLAVGQIDGQVVGGRDPSRLRLLQDTVYQTFYQETAIR